MTSSRDLEWHEGTHSWEEHDGFPRHQHSLNGQLTIVPDSPHLHFKGSQPAGVTAARMAATAPEAGPETARTEWRLVRTRKGTRRVYGRASTPVEAMGLFAENAPYGPRDVEWAVEEVQVTERRLSVRVMTAAEVAKATAAEVAKATAAEARRGDRGGR